MATITGSTSDTQAVTLEGGGHWLKDPKDPAKTIQLFVTAGPAVRRRRAQGTHRPLGTSNTVVVRDAGQAQTQIDLSLDFPTNDHRRQLEIAYNEAGTLLYQDPVGRQWYVMFDSDYEWNPANYAFTHLNARIRFVTVAKP